MEAMNPNPERDPYHKGSMDQERPDQGPVLPGLAVVAAVHIRFARFSQVDGQPWDHDCHASEQNRRAL